MYLLHVNETLISKTFLSASPGVTKTTDYCSALEMLRL